MRKKHKKSKGTKVAKDPNGPAPQCQMTEPEFSRWALFEAEVLSKVGDPEECKRVIAERQMRVDDDASEADLVAAYIRRKLRLDGQDPETCCVFWTTAEITAWLQEATGTKLAITKATPYLRALSIPELSYSKKNGVPGWVWRGTRGKPGQPARAFRKPERIPD